MRDEFRRVLQYKQMKGYEHDPLEALRQFDAAAFGVKMPARCSFKSRDPDDQVFIDLAVACGAKVLLSRDRPCFASLRGREDWGCGSVHPRVVDRPCERRSPGDPPPCRDESLRGLNAIAPNAPAASGRC